MKKGIVILLFLTLFVCGCGNKEQKAGKKEERIPENTSKVSENQKDEDTGKQEPFKEDKSAVSREDWIKQALEEEKARRIMPEIQGAEAILTYIAKTGGKAYKGTYEGATYYLYLEAEYNHNNNLKPYVTVVKEKDTGKNPEMFGGRENREGIVKDETERFLDIHTQYKFGYTGSGMEREIGNYIETEELPVQEMGFQVHFNSGKDLIYIFKEKNPDQQPGSHLSIDKEIHFSLMDPDEGKYWYSQNAMRGEWNDFMYYDGDYGDSYVRVEFTDGENMMDKSSHYYMTVLSSLEDLDTFGEKKYQIMTQNYSYSEFSGLRDEEFTLEFISDRQAVLTNKQTGTSALVKYHKGYLTEKEGMKDSEYYFYDGRMVERHDYEFEGKEYTASDGTVISFSTRGSWVNEEDITDVGERTIDIFYQGGRSALTAPVQVVDGKTLRVVGKSSDTELILKWSDENHFEVKGTGKYITDIDGLSFSYEENQLHGY